MRMLVRVRTQRATRSPPFAGWRKEPIRPRSRCAEEFLRRRQSREYPRFPRRPGTARRACRVAATGRAARRPLRFPRGRADPARASRSPSRAQPALPTRCPDGPRQNPRTANRRAQRSAAQPAPTRRAERPRRQRKPAQTHQAIARRPPRTAPRRRLQARRPPAKRLRRRTESGRHWRRIRGRRKERKGSCMGFLPWNEGPPSVAGRAKR